jgi:phospholipid/cholesterol/gamma-HCH transport system permease protein
MRGMACCQSVDFLPNVCAMVHLLGRRTLGLIQGIGDFSLFLGKSFGALTQTRKLPRRILRSIYEQGAVCLPVVAIVGLFTGLVLGLQGYHVLSRFGSEGLLGTMVSLSLVREMAPVLAALMLIGQSGSALAAELGIQRNTEQIAALETMGVNSLGYLVAPRLISAVFVYPAQAALFVVLGLWGGALSGSVLLGVDSGVYWSAVARAIEFRDLRECFIKASTFGLVSTAICAYQGYFADRNSSAAGARAVSIATTRAVVFSSIMVLVADYLISSFFVRA